MLEHTVWQNNIPIHRTLCFEGSEAYVERGFSRHRLMHNNLTASLSAEKLDDQSFVRYNF